MRINAIKSLWGRSANRCSICKLELTPNGEYETIGEIAHIVSQSPQGPRGDDPLPLEKRDDYSNLILLCPNHHSEIDKYVDVWPVSKLKQKKEEHEKWVSEKLEHGDLSFNQIDNSAFIETTKNVWQLFAEKKVWVVTSITPLSVNDDSIDTLDKKVIDTLNNLQLPEGRRFWEHDINRYDTRPDENGITNIRLKNLSDGDAHKISIYRNGHLEFLFCMERSINRISDYRKEKEPDVTGLSRIILYSHFAEVVIKEVEALFEIWNKCLHFKNMTLTISILNTDQLLLFSRERDIRGGLYGYPIQTNHLDYSIIIDKNDQDSALIKTILKRLVNNFGLVLNDVYNEKGEFVCPEKIQI
jgi:hypothetical protein